MTSTKANTTNELTGTSMAVRLAPRLAKFTVLAMSVALLTACGTVTTPGMATVPIDTATAGQDVVGGGGTNDTGATSSSSGAADGDGSSSGAADSAADDGAASSSSSSGADDAATSSSSGADDAATSSSSGADTSSSSGGADDAATSSSSGADTSSSSGSSGGGTDAGGSSGSSSGSSSGGTIGKSCTLGMGAPTIDCGDGNYCKLDAAKTCSGKGTCQPKPKFCNKMLKQVCGCDGTTYGNPCMAESTGRNVKGDGPCKTTNPCATVKCGVSSNLCQLNKCNPKTGKCEPSPAPSGSKCDDGNKCTGPDGCDGAGKCAPGKKDPNCGTSPGCCKGDAACKGGVCIGSSGAAGVCKSTTKLKAGQCWSAAQCGGKKCIGASVCPCGAQCIIADKPGKCDGAVTNPCAAIKCGDGNACTADTCNPKTGKCEFPAMKKGSKCQDGDKCTLDDKCDGGGKCTAGAKDPNCGKPPPAGCCNVTAECKGGVCIKGAGQAHGVCKSTTQLQAGECWSAAQCGGKECLAPNVCACGLSCFAPDKPGKCDVPTQPAKGCCNTNKDCTAQQVCFEGPFNAFKCMSLTVLQKGQCWTDAQCGAGSKCENAMGCGCKALCKAPDKPGVCSKPSNLGKTCTVGMGAPTIDCGKGNYCKLPVASCKGSGTCAAKPVMCTKELKQVCGCNSTSYGNKCMARSAGQNIKATGACVAKGCCKSDKECANGVCVGGALGFGVCKSNLVPKGKCWSNAQCGAGGTCVGPFACACNALCKAPDTLGTCKNAPAGCVIGKGPCAAGQYCNAVVGQAATCGGVGKCISIGGPICPFILKPVCGCNGVTYSNACIAHSKGMALAAITKCP